MKRVITTILLSILVLAAQAQGLVLTGCRMQGYKADSPININEGAQIRAILYINTSPSGT